METAHLWLITAHHRCCCCCLQQRRALARAAAASDGGRGGSGARGPREGDCSGGRVEGVALAQGSSRHHQRSAGRAAAALPADAELDQRREELDHRVPAAHRPAAGTHEEVIAECGRCLLSFDRFHVLRVTALPYRMTSVAGNSHSFTIQSQSLIVALIQDTLHLHHMIVITYRYVSKTFVKVLFPVLLVTVHLVSLPAYYIGKSYTAA